MSSVSEYAVFRIQGQACAVSMAMVKQVLQHTHCCVVPASPIWLAGLIELEGQAIPLFDLHFSPAEHTLDAHRAIIVLQTEHAANRWFALRVDDAPVLCSETDFLPATAEVATTVIDQLTRSQVMYAGQRVNILDSARLSRWSQQR